MLNKLKELAYMLRKYENMKESVALTPEEVEARDKLRDAVMEVINACAGNYNTGVDITDHILSIIKSTLDMYEIDATLSARAINPEDMA